MQPKRQKVGRYTVAVSLIALGAALLVDNITGTLGAMSWLFKFWPVTIVGFGVEYLVWAILYERRGEQLAIRFDFLGAFLLLLLMAVGSGITAIRYVAAQLPEGVRLEDLEQVRRTTSVPVGSAKTLVLDVPTGSVAISPALDANSVELEARFVSNVAFPFLLLGIEDRNWAEKAQFPELRMDGDRITVTSVAKSAPDKSRAQFILRVPDGMTVIMDSTTADLSVWEYNGNLDLRTARGGGISVNNLRGNLKAETDTGELEVNSVRGTVDLTTDRGNIRAASVTGDISARAQTGSINIADVTGKISAKTDRGSIGYNGEAVAGDIDLSTGTGNIRLETARRGDLNLVAKTGVGSIHAHEGLQQKVQGTGMTVEGQVGAGTHKVSLQAGTGSIHITATDDAVADGEMAPEQPPTDLSTPVEPRPKVTLPNLQSGTAHPVR